VIAQDFNHADLPVARIDARGDRVPAALLELRQRLSLQGEVISAEGAERTRRVFGEPLTPQQVVERICSQVQQRGLEAVIEFTEKLDGVRLDAASLRVPPESIAQAHRAAPAEWLATIRHVRENIEQFQRAILHRNVEIVPRPGVRLCQQYQPLHRAGICIPGGAAAYPSTILMTVVPAQVAGVAEIALVLPPTRFGAENPQVLAVCAELGIQEVYRVGGAQAVAALAFGVEGLPRVDKIVGPGNIFVALAKKWVYGHVDIDAVAGPSEIVLVADGEARPAFVAADMLAQAEHAPGSAILVTWSTELADTVCAELSRQLAHLDRANPIRDSLHRYGAIVLVNDAEHAAHVVDVLAPEHVHVDCHQARQVAALIRNAGAMFIGPYSPVAVGDYAAGPSHVLPTSGTARWASGLSANSFLRSRSVIELSREALAQEQSAIAYLATVEGLTAHRASVEIRFAEQWPDNPPR
jgi:histidinol dehydrogenase